MTWDSKEDKDVCNNYRVEFGGEDIDYPDGFRDCRKYYPIIKDIMDASEDPRWGIKHIWWFFEPYVEITWIANDDWFINVVVDILASHGIYDYREKTPADGFFADWYGMSPAERKFGYKRYAELRKVSQVFYDNEKAFADQIGWEKHYMRCTHVLANQMGLNYVDEAVTLFKRSIFCFLAMKLGNIYAMEMYEKVFKEPYMH